MTSALDPALLPLAVFTILGLEWDYTLRNVLFGSAILGIVGGVIGCLAVLRRQSLLSDAVAHAALPGICLAFLWTGVRDTSVLMVGAAITGLLGSLAVLGITRGTRLKEDAALGIVLSTFFGIGTVLLTQISRNGNADQAGLSRFLFGQAASLVAGDVRSMSIVGAVSLVIVVLAFKELKLSTFDPGFAASIGYPVTGLSVLLTLLIVAAIVIGLQSVGVILMVTVLVAPALAARQWTESLGSMMLLAAAFGGFSGTAGALLSARIAGLPTGPTIVLIASALVAVSLLFAPGRGIVWSAVGQRRTGATLRRRLQDRAPGSGPATGGATPHDQAPARIAAEMAVATDGEGTRR